jgi:hypothetical protein
MEAAQGTSPSAARERVHVQPSLVIHAGHRTYTVHEGDAPILIGREFVLIDAHGTIAWLRREGDGPDAENTEVLTNTVRAPLMVEAVEVALTSINAVIGSLPEIADPAFSPRAAAILADLRKLESVAVNAAHSAKGAPEVAVALGAVRKSYKDLMLRAARAPGATFGQRLFAARYRGELSAEETANAGGVPVEAVTAAEAEVPLDATTAAALSAVLGALTRR